MEQTSWWCNLGVLRLWRKLEQRQCNLEAGMWNKHDDDDDAIWEFKIVEQTGINMMMEFGS